MPRALCIMTWDERAGITQLAAYPEKTQVDKKVLMQIASTHEYSGEAGIVTLLVEPHQVMSYFTGHESGFYFVLLLTIDENPDIYEEGLIDSAHHLLNMIGDGEADPSYIALLPSLLQRISLFPSMNEEQRLALLLTNKIVREILDRLREEGSLLKSELRVWFKDKYRTKMVDVEAALNSLVNSGLVKVSSIPNLSSDVLFLVSDIYILRVPPVHLIEESSKRGLPAELHSEFLATCKEFFNSYRPSAEDELLLITTLADPVAYEMLKLLRFDIVTRDTLEKLKPKGVEDVDATFKILWDAGLTTILRSVDGEEFFALVSDVSMDQFFPKYLVNVIRECCRDKTKSNATLLANLQELEMAYNNLQERRKIEKVAKKNETRGT